MKIRAYLSADPALEIKSGWYGPIYKVRDLADVASTLDDIEARSGELQLGYGSVYLIPHVLVPGKPPVPVEWWYDQIFWRSDLPWPSRQKVVRRIRKREREGRPASQLRNLLSDIDHMIEWESYPLER